jgi:hypothetical protein
MKKINKDGKIVSIKDSPACAALIPAMAKRVKPVTLSASLRPVR